jgi:hypothetical protein
LLIARQPAGGQRLRLGLQQLALPDQQLRL